eukprot:Platyproteum_vivax@DN3181_c0_g1_i1.p1
MAPKSGKKKLPSAPLSSGKAVAKKVKKHPFIEATPKNFRIGGSILPTRDLTRFVRWPRYIRLQRQRQTLLRRLKVPPALNQFNCAIDKNQASQLLRLLAKYKPETPAEKKERLRKDAEQRAKGTAKEAVKKPMLLKYGLNHVTDLVEIKKARLVVIAHDVDPVELVCWLPALCRKKDIPYCIIKGKAELGKLVHKKTAAAVVLESVRKEDQADLDNLCRNFRAQFNDNAEMRRRWGGGEMGVKSQHRTHKKQEMIKAEEAKKMGLHSG